MRSMVELPTALLACVIYGSWLALTWWHASVPPWLLIGLGAWLVAWQSSLQHEVIHGHPTRSRLLNDAIGFPPLAIWLPYPRYKTTHLQHHDNERLTDPLDDPESRYLLPQDWERLGPLRKSLLSAQATLAGRLLIGPFWAVATFLVSDARAIIAGDRALGRVWAWHCVAAAAVLGWVVGICGMSVWLYLFGIAVPATSLMLIRSFCEHRAAYEVDRRTAVVAGRGPLSVLFLNNNLHAAHHEQPNIAWYRLPAYWRANRERLLAANGGLVYRGYGDVFSRFLLHPHDQVRHPLGRAPGRSR